MSNCYIAIMVHNVCYDSVYLLNYNNLQKQKYYNVYMTMLSYNVTLVYYKNVTIVQYNNVTIWYYKKKNLTIFAAMYYNNVVSQ